MTSRALTLAIATIGILAGAGALGACAQTPEAKASKDLEAMRTETTPERLQTRGEASATVGDLTRAEQYFVAALRAGGDPRALTKRLLIVCITDGRYPAAATYADDYLRKHPSDTDVRYAAATVYVGMGDLPRAREGLERVVTERPENADAHYALASVLRQEGDSLLEADKHYREYLRLSPDGEFAEAAKASLLKSVR
jgi:tetratricopeptide (TPR) repeat protein